MEGYIDENRWIDLSKLPRKKYGEGFRIEWRKSAGYKLPFKYGYAYGYIQIVKYRLKNCSDSMVTIVIDKYCEKPYEISVNSLLKCKLKLLVANRIADVMPDIMPLLFYKEDGYKYNIHSAEYIKFKCPYCGNITTKRVNCVCGFGFSCDRCSDGISRPNKIMRSVLEQCHISFISEANKKHGFSWMQTYKYDFYFKHAGQNILIEMDGGLHDRISSQKERDRIKTQLAKENNFKLIRIDCKYNDGNGFEYIKKHIIQSELSNILPLNIVKWDDCFIQATTNLLIKTCSLWEQELLPIKEIVKKVDVAYKTVLSYLQTGKELGICPTYSEHEARHRGNQRDGKPVGFILDGNIQNVFKDIDELSKKSVECFGTQFNKHSLYSVCSGNNNTYYGYNFKYITQDEYKQHKMIDNNGVVKEDDKL